jgi:hypothetical protein
MEKKKNRKESKASIKRIAAAALAGGLLISTPSASLADVKSKGGPIQDRVKMVRNALEKKMTGDQGVQNKLSYSETELAQWGNWGNWNNWYNWYNWNNWNNWGNWGNWGNF